MLGRNIFNCNRHIYYNFIHKFYSSKEIKKLRMQTTNLHVSARPNLGAAVQGRCTSAGEGGGRAPTGVGEDNREAEGRGSRTR
jgi:hypothetical protein